jgi:hypothetical protein
MAFVIVCRMANETHAYTKLQTMFGVENIGSFVIHHPRFGEFLGSQNAALILELLIGWDGHQWDRDGWIKKTAEEMEIETGLTPKQQAPAIKLLLKLGVIEKKRKKVPACNHFRIDKKSLQNQWIDWVKANPPRSKRPTVPAKEEPQSSPLVETTTYIPHEYTHSPVTPQENISQTETTETRNGSGDFESIRRVLMNRGIEKAKRELQEERERAEAANNPLNNPNTSIPSGDNSDISGTS